MVAVFSVFALLQMQDMQQMGVGLAVAVLVDATLVRMILLPSILALLDERSWYLPRWLGWLPRLEHGEPEAPPRSARCRCRWSTRAIPRVRTSRPRRRSPPPDGPRHAARPAAFRRTGLGVPGARLRRRARTCSRPGGP
ncbi:MMPL family transporter [Streptomyces sp. M19]